MSGIGLVLSGGMAKGAYQVGVLKAMEKYFTEQDITCISAASIGALNAYAYATHNLEYAEKMWKEATKEKKKYVASLTNSEFLRMTISDISAYKDIFTSKFYIPLHNIKKNVLRYVDVQKTPEALRKEYLQAAIAMPVLCKAVPIEENEYYDGAIIDNIPIWPLYPEPLDYIICVYFDNCNYIFEDTYLNQRVIKIVFYNEKRIMSSLSVDEEMIELMIREGYDKASRLFDFLFTEGKDNLDIIYRKKTKLEHNFLSSQKRITGDVAMNNFNRMAKKIVRRECNIQR